MQIEDMQKPGVALTEEDVRGFEQRNGLQLPAPYRQFLLRCNGGTPPEGQGHFHAVIKRKNKPDAFISTALTYFLTLDPAEEENLEWVFQQTKEVKKLSAKYLLIGVSTARFGFILLSLSKKTFGQVYLLNKDPYENKSTRYFLADDFPAFVRMLTSLEEDKKIILELRRKSEEEMGWHPVVFKETEKALLPAERLPEIEGLVGSPLPEDYKAFLLTDNNVSARPANVFDFYDEERKRQDSSNIRFFTAGSGKAYENLELQYRTFDKRIPKGCLPLGDNDGGDLICLDLSKKHWGTVWFWPHDSDAPEGSYIGMSRIADSFAEFLEMLHVLEE